MKYITKYIKFLSFPLKEKAHKYVVVLSVVFVACVLSQVGGWTSVYAQQTSGIFYLSRSDGVGLESPGVIGTSACVNATVTGNLFTRIYKNNVLVQTDNISCTDNDFSNNLIVFGNGNIHVDIFSDDSGTVFNPANYFAWTCGIVSGGVFTPCSDENGLTRIISHEPDNYATSSSELVSHTVEFYVSPSDFEEWSDNSLKISSEVKVLQIPVYFGTREKQEITEAGEGEFTFEFDFSDAPTGAYVQFDSTIIAGSYCIFDICFGGFEFLADYTTFYKVGTTTAYQDLLFQNYLEKIDFVASTTLEFSALSCNPISGAFNIFQCATQLFSEGFEGASSQVMTLVGSFLKKAPWGYATRVYEIVTASSTPATLPSLSIAMPSGLPVSGTLDLTPWDEIESAFTQVDEMEIETIEGSPLDQFLFWWNTLWYIVFGLWFLKTLHGAFEFGDLGQQNSDVYTVHRGGEGDKYAHEFSYLRKKKK